MAASDNLRKIYADCETLGNETMFHLKMLGLSVKYTDDNQVLKQDVEDFQEQIRIWKKRMLDYQKALAAYKGELNAAEQQKQV